MLSIILSTESLKLDLGDISDIAFSLPVDDFIELGFPIGTQIFPPMSKTNSPRLFDRLVNFTREDLKNFKCQAYKPIITIS